MPLRDQQGVRPASAIAALTELAELVVELGHGQLRVGVEQLVADLIQVLRPRRDLLTLFVVGAREGERLEARLGVVGGASAFPTVAMPAARRKGPRLVDGRLKNT